MKSSSGLLGAVLLFVAVPATAQTTQSTTVPTTSTPTLSDLAKKAQEKKAAPPATKTFTNDDLKSAPAQPVSRPARR